MKLRALVFIAAIMATAGATPASAKDLPAGGMTADEVASWLQSQGYQAKVETDNSGKQSITSSTGGTNFHVGFYDCKGARCGSMQFYAGFDTKGALNPVKMNEWNSSHRWTRGYVDKVNDPWVEMDIDLTPGGTYELLADEFAVWRNMLDRFKKFIGV
jgi:hypothetical protein